MTELPVVPSGPRLRPSRMAPRRALVLLGVHVAIAAHIAWWLARGTTLSPLEPSEAVAFSRAGIVNAGLLFFLAMIALTAVFGRFFCGWGCHLVALQDGARWLLEKAGRRPAPLRSRVLAWAPTAAFLVLFVWPLVRRMTAGGGPLVSRVDLVTTDFWARFPGWALASVTFLVCGGVAIWFLGAKGFCTYACPYGAAFAAADRLAPLRIRVDADACEGCGHCTAVCTSNIRVHEEVRDFGMVTSAGCMKCMDCVSVCPNDALAYRAGPIPLLAKPRRDKGAPGLGTGTPPRRGPRPLPWWEEAVLAVGFVAGFLAFRGLYGAVPILLAFGMAAVASSVLLLGARLATRRHLSFKGWRLKRDGALLPAGRAAVALVALALVLWAHSGLSRWTLLRAERGFAATAPQRQAAHDLGVATGASGDDDVRATLRLYDRLLALGFVPTWAAEERRAGLRLALGDLDGARTAAATSLDRRERPLEASLVLGTAAARAGDFEEALRRYDDVLSLSPTHRNALVNRGLALVELGRLPEAVATFRRGVEVAPEDPVLHYDLALAAALAGDTATAVAGFRRALELAPDDRAALENLAGTLAAAGRFDEALPLFRRALAQRPDDADTRVLLARVLVAVGARDEAREQLDTALRSEPEHAGARGALAALESEPEGPAPDGML